MTKAEKCDTMYLQNNIYIERVWQVWSDGVKSIHTFTRGIGVDLPFSVIRSRVFIKVCSFSKYFEIGLTFFRSYAENTIGDYIPERSVQPMNENSAGSSHSGIGRRCNIRTRSKRWKISLFFVVSLDIRQYLRVFWRSNTENSPKKTGLDIVTSA